MPVDRPTFSESWYRVCQLRPRLRSTVQIHRQHYRGQIWYVLQDPSNNQFFRQNEAAYHFVALLDGRRTIADVWEACNEELGDAAPTQGEAIQLLGQLYGSNLIQCELPPDAEGLFSRYAKRVRREVQGYLMNLLFIRIPLFDPDRILDRWVKVFGKLFSAYGFMAWLGLIATGLYYVVNSWGDLSGQAEGVLDPENLPLLYASFVFIKVIHEFGHAFACKKFGQLSGGGEVHVMGIMFLVFTPLPYVDASSSWAFRNKWHRVLVGMGGMLVELGVAAIAAVVWAKTETTAPIHAVAYNVMFIASVSTLLFNANPLLRYDGYYILSDVLEIPNLSQRAKQYIYYLVRRHGWSIRQARSPAHTRGERIWFVFYGIASTIYRVFICARILLFVSQRFFLVGVVLAGAAVITWVLVPLGKFVHYLATSGELMRVRPRAVISTVVVLALVIGGVGLIPAPDRHRLPGVVEPAKHAAVINESGGLVTWCLPSGTPVTSEAQMLFQDVCRVSAQPLLLAAPDTSAVVRLDNPTLRGDHDKAVVALAMAELRLQGAEATGGGELRYPRQDVEAARAELRQITQMLSGLTVRASVTGTWVSPSIDEAIGAWVPPNQQLGRAATLDRLRIRCVADQRAGAPISEESKRIDRMEVEIRVKDRPDPLMMGFTESKDVLPAGLYRLPSPALGYGAGGSVRTTPNDPSGTQAAEPYIPIDVWPQSIPEGALQPGQRVVARFAMPGRSLAGQGYRALLQLFQQRDTN